MSYLADSISNIFVLFNLLPKCWTIFVLIIAYQVLFLIIPVIIGNVIDKISLSSSVDWLIVRSILLLILSISGNFLLKIKIDKTINTSILELEKILKIKLWKNISNIKINNLEKIGCGSIHSKMTKDVSTISMVVEMIYDAFIGAIILIIFSILISFYKNPLFIAIIASFFIVCAVMYDNCRNEVQDLISKSHENYEILYKNIFSLIKMIPVLNMFSAVDQYNKYFTEIVCENINIELNQRLSRIRIFSRINFISDFGKLFILLCAILLCICRKISIGDIVIYQSIFSMSIDGIGKIFNLLPRLNAGIQSFNSINDVHVFNNENLIPKIDLNKDDKILINFKNVSYRYKDMDCNLFEKISFDINENEFVSIIGKNGSGKSTLAKILIGHYDDYQGEVLYNNYEMKSINKRSFYKKISYVPQNSIIYNDSIFENIRLKNCLYSEKDVFDVVKLCNLSNLVKKFENGINHIVDMNLLSGGEIQLICIARAMLREPRLIIFDEITNNLDYFSKKLVIDSIIKLKGKISIVIITHDIYLASLSDRMLILKNKNIINHINLHNDCQLNSSIFSSM